jgi:hypothetical protein
MKKMLFGEVSYVDETIASTLSPAEKEKVCREFSLFIENKKGKKAKSRTQRKPKTHAT